MEITVVKCEVVGERSISRLHVEQMVDHLEQNYRERCGGKGSSKRPEMELSTSFTAFGSQ